MVVSSKMDIFNELESCVRSYSRSFPTIFTKSKGYKLWDVDGKEYIDFSQVLVLLIMDIMMKK